MRRLKLIYNPNSGDKSFKNKLDSCIQEFQRGGYETEIFRSAEHGDIFSNITNCKNHLDAIVVAGGDGTINIAVNAIMRRGLKATLGIIPAGTANDFSNFLNIPSDPVAAAEVIAKGKKAYTDVGFANGSFFINVCCAGYLTNVSQSIDSQWKDALGKFAYYLKGIEQFPNFSAIPVKITNSKEVIQDNIFLFMVLNTSGTGGFSKLVPTAKVDDGKFDFIAIKALPFIDFSLLVLKLLMTDKVDDPRLILFRDNNIKVELNGEITDKNLLKSSIDGEDGPNLPIEVINIKHGLEIFKP